MRKKGGESEENVPSPVSPKNLPPGQYKVFAWEDVESGAWTDPDFIKPVADKGVAVTVDESGQETVQVKLIPADAAPEKQDLRGNSWVNRWE